VLSPGYVNYAIQTSLSGRLEVALPSEFDLLSNAVQRLEREYLRLKRIGISLLVLIGAALLMGQSRSTKTIEAEAFVLKSANGAVRAKLDSSGDSTEFLLYNDAGQSRVAIKSDNEGEGIEMRDDSGELLATVSVAVQKAPKLSPTTSTIAVLGSLAGPGVVMQATKQVATVRVDDKGGHRVWASSSQP
jgi:hypothetical protein